MDETKLLHLPDSPYAYPLSPDTLRLVLCIGKGSGCTAEVLYGTKYTFAAHRRSAPMRCVASDALWDYFQADLHLSDVRVAYVFKISGKENFCYTEEGICTGEPFPFFQFPYINAADVPEVIPWTKDAVFYQIFCDRFCRGMKGEKPYINTPWDGAVGVRSFTGGDIAGIAEKLPYLRDMGIDAIYLTPIYKAASCHKYDIEDYLTVDPMFGSNDDLKELLRYAHALGMRVVTDTVFNHCGKRHPFFLDAEEKGTASAYYDWFIIHGDFPRQDPCNYEIFGKSSNMPKWNTSNPQVRRYLISIAMQYLKWGFDGLRLDVADEVSRTLWRELRLAVKADFPEAVILGEVWHENSHYLKGDAFDGVMNYMLYRVLVRHFATREMGAKEAAERLNRVFFRNPRQNNAMMLNFLDNHDVPRFLHLCGGDVGRLKQALAALYFIVGMPCIYYGTEVPLAGGHDPDNRRAMPWGEMRLFGYLRGLAEMKRQLPCGDIYAAADADTLFLVRENEEERAVLSFGAIPAGYTELMRSENLWIGKVKR